MTITNRRKKSKKKLAARSVSTGLPFQLGNDNMPTQRSFTFKLEEGDRWMTTAEAADYLRISLKSLYNEISLGKIRPSKFGRRNRFLKSNLDRMMLSNPKGIPWQ